MIKLTTSEHRPVQPEPRAWYITALRIIVGVVFALVMISAWNVQKLPDSKGLVIVPSQAAQPSAAPTASPSSISGGGDPKNGERLFQMFQPAAGISCAACHRVDSEERLVGPGLLNVSIHAAGRIPGKSAEQYLRESILDPSAYVVDGYQDLMPKTWSKVFTPQQIDDLVAYLMALR